MKIDNLANINFNYEYEGGQTEHGQKVSNTVTTNNMSKYVTKVKTSSASSVQEGETVKHTIVITNNSQVALEEVNLTDYLTGGATLEAGSLVINGATDERVITDGLQLDDIEAGQVVTIEYLIRAKSPVVESSVQNYADLNYKVTNPDQSKTEFTECTNTVNVDVVSTRVDVVKSVDKTFAVAGDTLTYTIIITNYSTARIKDIQFRDQIPAGTTFVENSVTINGVSRQGVNPEHTFNLDPLTTNQQAVVTFKVTVNS